MSAVTRRIRPWMTGVMVVAIIVVTSALRSTADAQTVTSFDLQARADTVSFSLTDPALPLFNEVVVTPGSAQATATSFGGSNSFAGAPYTGDLSTLLGTANGLAAGALPILPSYMPGYVISSFPQDPGPTSQEVATYLVSTESSPNGSSAEARLGGATEDPAALASIATADVRVDDDASRAHAEAWVGALRLGGLVGLGEVSASATVTVDADGTIEKESSVDIGLINIAGIRVGLGPDGLQVGDTVLGLVDLTVVNQLLNQAGIDIEYMPAEETETSITSAGVRVTMAQDVPTQGRVVTTFTLGRVSASVNVRIPTTPVDVAPTTPAPEQPAPAQVSPPAPSAGVAAPVVAPLPSSPSGADVAAPEMAMPASVQVRAIDLGADGVDFYLILVLGFFAPVVASRLASAVGVRVRR